MTSFRLRILGVLGSVVSLGACGGDTGVTTEADLKEGLDGDELCTSNVSGSLSFSPVKGLNPIETPLYLAWRGTYFDPESARSQWESTRSSIEEAPDLTDEERREMMAEEFARIYTLQSETGACLEGEGCDPFLAPPSDTGFWYWDTQYHLFAYGPSGPSFVTTEDELKDFLGEIDTPNEAAWIAFANGYDIECDGPSHTTDSEGYIIYAERGTTCGGDVTGHRLLVRADGTIEELDSAVVEKGEPGCVIGRLPAGSVEARTTGADEHPVSRYFAEVARLEASSVLAFREIAFELRHHGAPDALIEWAERAAREETRHALACRGLAERYGSRVSPVRVSKSAPRSLFEMARDNAVEGLTREAFGALLAHHQAVRAKDSAVRRTMQQIAVDETSHAEFSIALHRWLTTKLDERERALIEDARHAAREQFRCEAQKPYADEIIEQVGMPTPEVSRKLFDALFEMDFAA